MIKIGQPYIEQENGLYFIRCLVKENGEEKLVYWGGVNEDYSKYLLYERSDAFLIGLLSYAMRGGHDIVCEAPVSEELLYNIRQYLIPLVTKYGNLYPVKIEADTASVPLGNAGMVGASASCGVDSFNTIVNQVDSPYPSMNITHLCLNDVGAYNSCYGDEKTRKKVRDKRYAKGRMLAADLNLPVITTYSNYGELFPQNHLFTNTYSSVFSIMCMRKFWRVYYYSSAFHDMGLFSLKNNERKDSSYYDLLSLNCFSTDGIRIYSEGGERTRLDKVRNITDFPLAQKYLHVCIRDDKNCGICSKCMRTLLDLEIVNKLEQFQNVFDIDAFKKKRKDALEWFFVQYVNAKEENQDMYDHLREDEEFCQVVEECRNTGKILADSKLIVYGMGDLGQKVEQEFGDRIAYRIDNKIKGEGILTLEEFQEEFHKEEREYTCLVTSISKYVILKKQIEAYYPHMNFISSVRLKAYFDGKYVLE